MRIAFLNPQGNFDNEDSYLTEHPDFGGQLVYVKELAIALAKIGIEVDIITRQIIDKEWKGFEERIDSYDSSENVRIIRIPFGGKSFLKKEDLWPQLYEYVEGIIRFYKDEGRKPDFITSHYGDGGVSAAMLYERTGIPYTFTGHSLGAQKMDKLRINKENIKEMNQKYNFIYRIMAERISMANSAVNIVSTKQERFEQYGHKAYQGAVKVEEESKFKVIAPGANTEVFNFEKENDRDNYIKSKIDKVFTRDLVGDRQELSPIIAASRLDSKKNHIGLVKAFGENKELQEKANLIITLRGIDNPFIDYSNAKEEEKKILDEIMNLIEEYNLKGKISMFSINSQKELAATYREMTRRRGIFALTALYEPFGLAPIEAMASGLPAVVTQNGGPTDVLREDNKEFGVLVDPEDLKEIGEGLLKVLESEDNYIYYKNAGINRVFDKFTWDNTAKNYLEIIKEKMNNNQYKTIEIPEYFFSPNKKNEISLEWLEKTYLKGDNNERN